MNRNTDERLSQQGDVYFMSHINPVAFDSLNEDLNVVSVEDKPKKKRNVRVVYCGDGVVEECSEDEDERRELEAEEKKRQAELQKQLDADAKNLTWGPWLAYMTKKNAVRSFEAADYMGEKLAWWLGITKPKFQFEIEEYKRMQKEEEEARQYDEDIADEIVVGEDGRITELSTRDSIVPNSRKVNSNTVKDEGIITPDKLFQAN